MHRSAAVGGDTFVAASPLNFSGLGRAIRLPTPDPGDRTDEVMHSVGHADAEIAELRQKRAVLRICPLTSREEQFAADT